MSKYDHIEISGMPSWETMNKYLADKLSEEDKKVFEEKISDDPMLADAMEGLAETSDIPGAKAAITRIRRASELRMATVANQKREKLIKRKSRVSPSDYTKYMVAAAAAIAFLVLSVYIILDFQKTNKQSSGDLFASKKQAPTAESQPELAESSRVNEEREKEINNNVPLPVEPNKAEANTGEYKENKPGRDIELSSGALGSSGQPIVSNRSEARKDFAPVAKPKLSEQPSPIRPSGNGATVVTANKPSEELAANVPTETMTPPPIFPGFSDSLGEEGEIASDELIASIPLDTGEDDLGQEKADELIREQEELRSREGVVLSEVEAGRTKTNKSSKKKLESYNYSAPANSTLTYDPQVGQLAKGVAIADLLVMAQENYETEQYPAAKSLLQEVLLSEPKNLVANYYLGSLYRLTGEPKLAISNLKKVVNHPESPLFEEGEWELTQAYVARKKNKSAIELLEAIIARKGKYQLAAQKLLDELE